MINFIELNNVASYRSATRLETDKKVNILYGLNGVGKSTLSNYFSNSGDNNYKSCSHSDTDCRMLVYNQKFIQDNFHVQDSLKGIFSLSKDNVDIRKSVEKITEDLDKINEEKNFIENRISDLKLQLNNAKISAQDRVWEIKKNYSGGDRVLEFCLVGKMGKKEVLFDYLCSISLLEEKPLKAIEELKEEVSNISGNDAIKYDSLNTLSVPCLTQSELSLLDEIIIGSEDSPVAKLIGKLNNSDWVSKGLSYLNEIDDNQCPFCQSETITSQLIEEINEYFDETYKENITAISIIQTRYEKFLEDLPNLGTYRTLLGQDYMEGLAQHYSQISKKLSSNLELINKKLENPSLEVKLMDIEEDIESFNKIIVSINKAITEHNTKIDNSGRELIRIQKEFWSILRYEYDQTISSYQKLASEIGITISDEQQKIEDKIVDVTEKTTKRRELQKSIVNVDEAIESINQGLLEIGITDFHIERHQENTYRLARHDCSLDIFSSLSEGEKMIISFLYFRELFKGKQSEAEGKVKKIAVIDDPVSSLSHIFVYNIGQLIKNDFFNSKNVEQVFVLTHSLYFFYELTDTNHNRRKETQKLFRISKNETGSNISVMQYEEIQNDYQSYWSIVNDNTQPTALIANCMRNIVEYFFNFVQKADLSNVMQLPALEGVKYQAFIRYINRESHSLGQNIFDFKEFDYDGFKEGLKLLFELTGYSEHYEKMSKIGATK